jgi:CPA2 family monovalent cation:H+ antiporter-2
MIAALPLFVATFRKLQALGRLVAETKMAPEVSGERTSATRTIVAQVIPFTGIVAFGLYVILLSSPLLPPVDVLIVLVAVVALVAWLLGRAAVRVYAMAQEALQETFAQDGPPRHDVASVPIPSMLRQALLETVIVDADSLGSGKLIRDLQLRTRTGASIVGIERDGGSVINPGPDEELQPGDRVLLLGNRSQLDAAKAVLNKATE